MIEKIDINEVERNLPEVNSVSKVRGMSSDGCGALINPAKLPHPNTGSAIVDERCTANKWYRIALGAACNMTSSGIFNIGNQYNGNPSRAIAFYAFVSGYGGYSSIEKIGNSTILPITKARVLFKNSVSDISLLDIFVSISGINSFTIAASCLIGFKLQPPEEVSGDIPEGYSVKEFAF